MSMVITIYLIKQLNYYVVFVQLVGATQLSNGMKNIIVMVLRSLVLQLFFATPQNTNKQTQQTLHHVKMLKNYNLPSVFM